MVRPNQIVERDGKELTFILFAQSKEQAARRAVAVNFPMAALSSLLGGRKIANAVTNTELLTEGMVNRYLIAVDTSQL